MIPARAAVYLRVSTDRQDERNQEPECLRLSRARGWAPFVYRETESGAKADRPVWRMVVESARRGEVQAVVVWSIDRIGRRMFQIVADVGELARLGCAVVSVREPWLDTSGPTRELLLSIFAWVSQYERERLQERTRAGMERARAAGKQIGRPSRIAPKALRRALAMRTAGKSWGDISAAVRVKRTAIAQAVTRELSRKVRGPG